MGSETFKDEVKARLLWYFLVNIEATIKIQESHNAFQFFTSGLVHHNIRDAQKGLIQVVLHDQH